MNVHCSRLPRKVLARRASVLAEALEPRQLLAVFFVTNADDSGSGSLRDALTQADSAPTPDTITFDTAGVFATPQNISLLTALPQISGAGGALSINGPGASALTIQRDPGAATSFRILFSTAPSLTLSGFRITGGNAGGDGGGLNAGGIVTLDNMVVSGNSAFSGGGMRIEGGGSLKLRNSTISGNSAEGSGGGIYFPNGGSMVIENSTISGNTSDATYEESGGGGIYFFGSASSNPPPGFTANTLVIRNSTISGNTAANSGGGIYLSYFGGTLLVQDSTISNNAAMQDLPGEGGGGIARPSSGSGTVTLTNSVVSGNSNANAPDILSDGTVNANFCAIGSTSGFTPSGANNLVGVNLLLGPLTDNGGPTLTMAPQPASPLIDAGSNAAVGADLLTDQRGAGHARILGGSVDIGAIEVQPDETPAASAAGTEVTSLGATTYTFTVKYLDPAGANPGINVASIIGNNSAIRVSGPGGFNVPATYVSIDNSSNGSPRTATYAITPPGGSWDGADSGAYTILILGNQVRDLDDNFVPGGNIGSFDVSISQKFLVTNTNDSGAGSFRNALIAANASSAADTISFDTAGVFATPQTITLLGALPQIPLNGGGLTILGSGASRLTIRRDGSAATRFRLIDSAAPTLNISSLTLTGGDVEDDGGGLLSTGFGATVSLDGVVITGNSSDGRGGAIYINTGGFLAIRNGTIAGNTSNFFSGGIFMFSGGGLLIENTSVSGNTGTVRGGGIYFYGTPSDAPPPGFTPSTLVIRNCTISSNTTGGDGAGIYLREVVGTIQLQNSTISGNTADQSGGGINLYRGDATLLVQNSTVTNNTAKGTFPPGIGGGGISWGADGSITIQNSVVSGNSANTGPDILASFATTNINYSAIGSNSGFTLSASSGNNLPFGTNLLLGALSNNGGSILTRVPQSASPLINAGSNALVPAILSNDQRGLGFFRISGPSVDIGSVEVDTIRPSVSTSSFNYITGPQSIRYTFSEPVKLTVDALDLHNVTTGAIIPAAKIKLDYDSATNTATFTFPGYADGVLPNGDYRAFLLATGISDFSANHPAIDHMTIFSFLLGDLNGDRQVSIADFIGLASNFGKTGMTYVDGDLNYDGNISIADFISLASNFGVNLGTPPPATPQSSAALEISALDSQHKVARQRHHRRARPSSPSKEAIRIIPFLSRV